MDCQHKLLSELLSDHAAFITSPKKSLANYWGGIAPLPPVSTGLQDGEPRGLNSPNFESKRGAALDRYLGGERLSKKYKCHYKIIKRLTSHGVIPMEDLESLNFKVLTNIH